MDKASPQHPRDPAASEEAPAEAPEGQARSRPTRPRSKADCELVQRLLAAAKSGADVRTAKVRRVKAAIEDRAYENDLKLEIALQRLQERLRQEGAIPEERCDPPGPHHTGTR
jgi:hypothetical protein